MTQTKKELGQHWLHDEDSLDAVVAGADVQAGDVVLEIGPGLGTLTRRLLDAGAKVTAIEFDQSLLKQLRATFKPELASDQFTLLHDDILKYDLTKLPNGYKVSANIPYYLTSNLLRTFCDSANPPTKVSLLVQKEVAERVAAKPGDMSLLSVTTQFYYEASLGPVVLAELFAPPPKVDSQVIILKLRAEALFTDVDVTKFFQLVRAGFGERRKKLRSSLSGGLRIEKEAVEKLCGAANIDFNLRAQALSLQDWHALYKELSS